jgi:hypothetical protein
VEDRSNQTLTNSRRQNTKVKGLEQRKKAGRQAGVNKCNSPDPIRSEQKRDVAGPKETPGRRRGEVEGRRCTREERPRVVKSPEPRDVKLKGKSAIPMPNSRNAISLANKTSLQPHPTKKSQSLISGASCKRTQGAKGTREVCCEIHKPQPKPIRRSEAKKRISDPRTSPRHRRGNRKGHAEAR